MLNARMETVPEDPLCLSIGDLLSFSSFSVGGRQLTTEAFLTSTAYPLPHSLNSWLIETILHLA